MSKDQLISGKILSVKKLILNFFCKNIRNEFKEKHETSETCTKNLIPSKVEIENLEKIVDNRA